MASLKLSQYRTRQFAIGLVGLLLVSVGVILGLRNPPHLYWSGILLSTGCSIVAAVVISFMSPLSEEAYENFMSLGISSVYPSRRDVEPRKWVQWLRSAKHNCVMVGIAHGNWCRDPDFEGALTERLHNNVDVKIFFLRPIGSAADLRAKEDKGRDTVHQIKTSIGVIWNIRRTLAPELAARLKLFVYEATPSMGMTWIDEFMIATHYLAGSENVTSPALLLEPSRFSSEHEGLYGIYAKNVQSIEKEFSEPITEANIGNFTLPGACDN